MKLIISIFGIYMALQSAAMAGCIPCNVLACGTPIKNCCGPVPNCNLKFLSAQTATGIALDQAWKQQIYNFAQKYVVHPAWGIAHSERNYQVSIQLATQARISLDTDVLFAAAFLHDLGGLPEFEKKNVDHATRSVELIEPLLNQWQFPMEKWPQVKEMILGHTYYGPKPQSLQAQVFHDADVLDFLGVIGVARIFAVAEEGVQTKTTLQPSVQTLISFSKTMSQSCILPVCRQMAKPRQMQLEAILKVLSQQSFNNKAL